MVFGTTRKLNASDEVTETAIPEIKPIDMGMPRPWRIALRVIHMQLQLVFDLTDALIVGRAHPESGVYPNIDLSPFKAEEFGLSREHLQLKLKEDRVVVVDNSSSNGTWLNGERLEPMQDYWIRHMDLIKLGIMVLQVELLTNPFD